jgi:putative sporulation protein YtxC
LNIILLIIRRSLALFHQRLQNKSGCLNNLNFDYDLHERGLHEKFYYFFPKHPGNNPEQLNGIADFLSDLLAPYIVYDLRAFLLDDLIRYHYFYFRKEERVEILSTAQQSMETGVFSQRQDTHREIIRSKLKDYLSQESHLHVEGFIHFRLPDYRRELKRVVDLAVDRYLKEKEYREFVRLLKYFLDLQEPKIDLVHLAVNEKGQFQITDYRFQVINPRDWEEFNIEECEGENDYEDILVSMLVTVAPRRIVLHQNVLPRYPRAVETLRRIFDHRVLFCKNCYYCRQDVFQQINWEKQ